MLKQIFSFQSLKAWLSASGAALAVLGYEYFNIPEQAGREFTDGLIEQVLAGAGWQSIITFVLIFAITWFIPNLPKSGG